MHDDHLPANVRRQGRGRALLAAAVLLLATCGDGPPAETARAPAVAEPAPATPRYLRDFVFVGRLADTAVVVPLRFESMPEGEEIQRAVRGWLAFGGTWDAFLEDRSTSPAASGVWRVLPTAELRVIAGGTSEVESLVFRRGERTLRLRLGESISEWSRDEETRYRLLAGRLDLRGTTLRGTVLETQRVQTAVAGADAESSATAGELDLLFLTDGGEFYLLLAAAYGGEAPERRTYAWFVGGEEDRATERAELNWLEMVGFAPARRDVPVRWSYRLPDAGIEGEVRSLGFHPEVGEEHAGRRAVEIHHSVEGWVSIGGEQRRVFGTIVHSQG